MKKARILSLLLAACSAGCQLHAAHIYLDSRNGFGTLTDTQVLSLESPSALTPAKLLTIQPSTDVALGALVRNKRASIDAIGSYTDRYGNRHAAARPGIEFVLANSTGDTLRASIRSMPVHGHDTGRGERFGLSVSIGDTVIMSAETEEGADSPFHIGHDAGLQLRISLNGLAVLEGTDKLSALLTCDTPPSLHDFIMAGITGAGVAAMPGGKIEISRLSISTDGDPGEEILTTLDLQALNARFSTSADRLEGYWTVLDYTADDTMLRPGGRYTVAMVSNGRGSYRLIYVNGAEVNASAWKPGRIKAMLHPASLPGAYRAVWYDAEGRELDPECAVQIDTPRVMTVQFPRLLSTLRLHKVIEIPAHYPAQE